MEGADESTVLWHYPHNPQFEPSLKHIEIMSSIVCNLTLCKITLI